MNSRKKYSANANPAHTSFYPPFSQESLVFFDLEFEQSNIWVETCWII